jgi:3-oxoacyl-[acyl-carrier protein] reductase
MQSQVEATYGPIDILVAFAGGFGTFSDTHHTSIEEWRSVIESNLTATFLATKAVLPAMIERRSGAIVTMSSNTARHADILLTSAYAASKAGILGFTRHLAMEVAKYQVRVNCIAPGTALSERVVGIMSERRRQEVAGLTPLGRLGDPQDSAQAVAYLVSDASSYVTGITLDVAGGRVRL